MKIWYAFEIIRKVNYLPCYLQVGPGLLTCKAPLHDSQIIGGTLVGNFEKHCLRC